MHLIFYFFFNLQASQITKVIQDVADVFKCNPVADFRSFQVERNVIEGEKSIPNRKNEEENDEDCTFAENEVYILDILMSSGSGKVIQYYFIIY